MATSQKNRARMGYLNYEAMLAKIEEGKLDAYDVNYTPDTHECYVISPELKPWSVKAKVYVFDNEVTAVETLNQNTDTYAGQLVSILSGDTYKAYVVNKNNTGFYVEPLSHVTDNVDYDTLGNRPIINLTGTLDEPVMVEKLENGIYAIIGQYQISHLLGTVFLSATRNLFMVEHSEDGATYVKKITSREITNYTIVEEEIIISHCVTTQYLEEQGFATTAYVDGKIAALDFITRGEVDEYVKQLVSDILDEVLDEKIETKLNEMIQAPTEDDIFNMFA